jgi:tRNA modification GTPase
LTEAEAVIHIITAKSRGAARSAMCVKEGALRRKISAVKDDLLSLTAHLSAWADYPEEDIAEVDDDMIYSTCDSAVNELEKMLSTYDAGQAVKQGIDTVIAGRPNVGKSTLMNLLSGSEKSIVTDIPGTTRDIVEDTVVVGDVILRLSDTAGLRNTDDAVEKIGVDRAKKRLEQCGLLLAVFDNSQTLSEDDYNLIEASQGVPTIAIINKTDLENKLEIDKIKSKISNIIYISAANGEGKEDIITAVEKIAGTARLNPSEGILSNERQRANVSNALKSVKEAKQALELGLTYDAVTVSLEDAISELLEMTGEKTSDEVLDRVFHNFCVGK